MKIKLVDIDDKKLKDYLVIIGQIKDSQRDKPAVLLEKASPEEGRFMADLVEALSHCGPKLQERELTNWGGWWRNRFRENPRKARRILAELSVMIRERRIQRNAGAAGKDLWDRLP